MMKKAIIILSIIITGIFSLAAEDYTGVSGVYECKNPDSAQFLELDNDEFFCIALFDNGRYALYTKKVNRLNPSDVRYIPGNHGSYNIFNGLLYLQPIEGKLQILEVKQDKLVGSYSEYEYLKK